jgi:anti-sigma B factor antagonist
MEKNKLNEFAGSEAEDIEVYASEQDEDAGCEEKCGCETAAEPEAKETSVAVSGELAIIAPVGRLDTVTSAELKELIAEYDISGRDIEFDFSNVDYISSAGLRLLVSLQKQAKADGHTMVLRNTNAVVNEVLRVSGFNKAFTVL